MYKIVMVPVSHSHVNFWSCLMHTDLAVASSVHHVSLVSIEGVLNSNVLSWIGSIKIYFALKKKFYFSLNILNVCVCMCVFCS